MIKKHMSLSYTQNIFILIYWKERGYPELQNISLNPCCAGIVKRDFLQVKL